MIETVAEYMINLCFPTSSSEVYLNIICPHSTKYKEIIIL